MPILFRSTPVVEPFTFDSLGNHWEQDRISRPKGYPFYHYLQTESGTGAVKVDGKTYLLHENEGILIAPFLRHSYEKQGEEPGSLCSLSSRALWRAASPRCWETAG